MWEWGAPGHNRASQGELRSLSLLGVLEVFTKDNPHQSSCLRTLSLPVETLSVDSRPTCWIKQSSPNLCPPSGEITITITTITITVIAKGRDQWDLRLALRRNAILRELHLEVWLTGKEIHKVNDRCVLRS